MYRKTIALLLTGISFLIISCNQSGKKENPSKPATVTSTSTTAEAGNKPLAQPKPVDKSTLIGDWTRTDSPYQLKITELLDDGTMKVGYFNPKSINVGKSSWKNSNGVLEIYVELRDVNYPGSSYTLYYFPEKDLLAGKYFQAVEGLSYDIGFMRSK
jgi:hypothetical protein